MVSLLEQLKRNPEIDMESPFCVEIEGTIHTFQCLIRGYGSEKGMIVDENFKRILPVKNALTETGYGFSCFDILGDNSSADEFIKDVLMGDWGKNEEQQIKTPGN